MNSLKFSSKLFTPSKVVCIGRNYADHISELGNDTPTEPVIFIKPNSAVTQQLKSGSDAQYHYEGEIALLIRSGIIVGIGFGLDLTHRQLQTSLKKKGLPWERAKAFDGAAVFSELVPLEVDLESLRLELTINQGVAQEGGVDLMIYKPEFLLSEIKKTFTLEDNDIIMTGTPKGVGNFTKGDEFIGRIFADNNLLIEHCWTAE